jgi:F0F1-type ATP synthase membrane subunit b/b'
MTESFINQLIQGGAMGLFAAFLVWQHVQMQKRLDNLVERFQEQLDKINADYDLRINGMRERYDVVIQQYRQEAKDIQQAVAEKVDENARKLDTALGKLDEGLRTCRPGSDPR